MGRLGLRLGNLKVSRLLAWITRSVQLLKRTEIKRVEHTPGKTHRKDTLLPETARL